MLKLQLFFVTLFFSGNIFAYIDPGSGSAVTAAIIAFLSGVYFYIKKYYYIIKNFLKKILHIKN
jgi:hypothetical protein